MDDQEFLRRFEACAIPNEEWDHRAHLRMAFLYLRRAAFSEAVRLIRSGIQALNRANGVETTDTSGYHETLTLVWARIVAARIASDPKTQDFAAFVEMHTDLLDQRLVLRHYSPERISSPRARSAFVLPDREPLPSDVSAL